MCDGDRLGTNYLRGKFQIYPSNFRYLRVNRKIPLYLHLFNCLITSGRGEIGMAASPPGSAQVNPCKEDELQERVVNEFHDCQLTRLRQLQIRIPFIPHISILRSRIHCKIQKLEILIPAINEANLKEDLH